MSSSIVSIVNITRNCLLRTNLRSEVIKRLLSSNSSNNNRVLLQKVNANEERFYEEPKRNYPMKLDSRELKLEPVVGTLEKSSYLDDCLSSRDIPHERVPGALEECTVDISHIVPSVQPTYNFAAYADKSPTIQQLVKLGVDLHQIEQDHDVFKFFLGLDFDKDIKPYIMFLHNCGVPADCIGEFITKNPKILMESLEDLTVRIRYLRAHKFGIADIARIVTDNPFWLMFSTKKIDGRLGFFQYEFQLTGQELRYLTVKCPKLMTRKLKEIREITFAVKEEMGFDQEQVKAIILAIPKLWRRSKQFVDILINYYICNRLL